MIINVFCRCGCGQQTGVRDLPVGAKCKSRLFGVVRGHKAPIDILDDDYIRKQVAVGVMLNAVSVMYRNRKS